MTVIDCDDETYGYNCVNICSGHCLNDSPCNKTSGHCDRGCQPGYTNNRCNKGKCIDQSFFFTYATNKCFSFRFNNPNALSTILLFHAEIF